MTNNWTPDIYQDADVTIDHYQIQIASDINFNNVVKDERVGRITSKTWRLPKPGHGTYYARVRSVDSMGNKSVWVTNNNLLPTPPTPPTPVLSFDQGEGNSLVAIADLDTSVYLGYTDDDISRYEFNLKSVTSTTLSNAASAGDLSIDVVSNPSDVPNVPYIAFMGAEDVIVTSKTGGGSLHWVVTRGTNATAAADHRNGSRVYYFPQNNKGRRVLVHDDNDGSTSVTAEFGSIDFGGKYAIRVRAIDKDNVQSAWSAWSSVTRAATDSSSPPQPAIPTITFDFKETNNLGSADVTFTGVGAGYDADDISRYLTQLIPASSMRLTNALSNSATSFTIKNSGVTEPSLPFIAYIRDEAINVTNVVGTTWTIETPGTPGVRTGVKHNKNAKVQFFNSSSKRFNHSLGEVEGDVTDPYVAVFHKITYGHYYKARVRSVDKHNRVSPWSSTVTAAPAYRAGGFTNPSNTLTTSTGAISAGSSTLTSGSSVWTSDDVGKSIIVGGAGPLGADMNSIIIGYTSGTSVSLATLANTNVTGATVQWSSPDPPTNFAFDVDNNYMHLTWDVPQYADTPLDTATASPGDVTLLPTIAYFQVQVTRQQDTNYSNLVHWDNSVLGSGKQFKFNAGSGLFRARVRSVDITGAVSPWSPEIVNAGASTTPSPGTPTLVFAAVPGASNVADVYVTWGTSSVDANIIISNYSVQLRTSVDNTFSNPSVLENTVVDDGSTTFTSKFANIPTSLWVEARVEAHSRLSQDSPWTNWTSAAPIVVSSTPIAPTSVTDVGKPGAIQITINAGKVLSGVTATSAAIGLEPAEDRISRTNQVTNVPASIKSQEGSLRAGFDEDRTTATFTKTAHGLTVGTDFSVSGMSPAGYNGNWIVSSVINANSWQAVIFGNPLGAGSGGTVNSGQSSSQIKYYEIDIDTANTFNTAGKVTISNISAPPSPYLWTDGVPGTFYYIRARGIDGFGNPSAYTNASPTPVTPLVNSDGNPPGAAVTSVVLTPAVGKLTASWISTLNADPTIYELYLDEDNAFTMPAPNNYIGETSGPSDGSSLGYMNISSLPNNGGPLVTAYGNAYSDRLAGLSNITNSQTHIYVRETIPPALPFWINLDSEHIKITARSQIALPAIARVQTKGNTSTGTGTVSVGAGQGWATPTITNLLIMEIAANGASVNPTINIPANWIACTPQLNVDTNEEVAQMFYKVSDGTESTISVSLQAGPSGTNDIALIVSEYSGFENGVSLNGNNYVLNEGKNLEPLEDSISYAKQVTNVPTGIKSQSELPAELYATDPAVSPTTGAITTTIPNAVIATLTANRNNSTQSGHTGGFTERVEVTSGNGTANNKINMSYADRIVSSTGTYSTTTTLTAPRSWVGFIQGFYQTPLPVLFDYTVIRGQDGTIGATHTSGSIAQALYFAKVRAKDVDGISVNLSNPSVGASILFGPTSDKAAPASNPTPILTAGINKLVATWTPIDNPDPTTYSVHLSTSSSFTPDTTTLVGTTVGTSLTIPQPPGTDGWNYSNTYYSKVIANDNSGQSVADSSGVMGISNPIDGAPLLVSGTDIAPADNSGNGITAGHITGGAITSDKLDTEFILSGSIKTAISGKRVEIDAGGITLFDANGRSVLVDLPTGSNTNVTVNGDITAQSLDTKGEASFESNVGLNQGSVTTLYTGQSNPSTPPAVGPDWPKVSPPSSFTVGTESVISAVYDAFSYDSNGYGGQPTFLCLAYDSSKSGNPLYLIEIKASDGSFLRGMAAYHIVQGGLNNSYYSLDVVIGDLIGNIKGDYWDIGVTRCGNYVYMLFSYTNNVGNTTFRVLTFNQSNLSYVTIYQPSNDTPAGGSVMWIGRDSEGSVSTAHPIIAFQNSSGQAVLKTYSVTGIGGLSAITSSITTSNGFSGQSIWGFIVDDINSAIYVAWAGPQAGNGATIRKYGLIGSYISGQDFTNGLSNTWSGITMNTAGTIYSGTTSLVYTHSNFTANTYFVGYSWHDNTTHESSISPRSSIALKNREYIAVSVGKYPSTAVSGWSTKIYALQTSTDPAPTNLKLQTSISYPDLSLNTTPLATYNGAGAADVASNFPTSLTPAILESQDQTSFVLKGDGFFNYLFIGVRAYMSATQTISNGNTNSLIFDVNDYQSSTTIHSTTTNNTRFTIPAGYGGLWRCTLQATSDVDAAGQSQSRIIIKLNGSTTLRNFEITGTSSHQWGTVITDIVKLTAGDYIEFQWNSRDEDHTLQNGSTLGTIATVQYVGLI